MTTSTPSSSRLLELPFEIRQEIFRHVFTPFALSIERTAGCKSAVLPYSTVSRCNLRLLRTNRQIHRECTDMLNSRARLLAFRIPFVEGLEILPPVKRSVAWGIKVVIFPTRAGSQELLSMLPNLEAIGVCRDALGGGPPVMFRENGSIQSLRDFMSSYVSNSFFIHALSQQWLHQYLRNPARKAKVWCRIVSLRVDHNDSEHMKVREAVWINLEQRSDTTAWRWCKPTYHDMFGTFESARYHSELAGEVDDGNLQMINKWWSAGCSGRRNLIT